MPRTVMSVVVSWPPFVIWLMAPVLAMTPAVRSASNESHTTGSNNTCAPLAIGWFHQLCGLALIVMELPCCA